MAVTLNCQPIFKFFTVFFRFSSKFAAKHLLKVPTHLTRVTTLPCGTLMSENERTLTRKLMYE